MTTQDPLHREVSWMTFVNRYLEDASSHEDEKYLPQICDQQKEKLKQEAIEFMQASVDCHQLDVSISDSDASNITSYSETVRPEKKETEEQDETSYILDCRKTGLRRRRAEHKKTSGERGTFKYHMTLREGFAQTVIWGEGVRLNRHITFILAKNA